MVKRTTTAPVFPSKGNARAKTEAQLASNLYGCWARREAILKQAGVHSLVWPSRMYCNFNLQANTSIFPRTRNDTAYGWIDARLHQTTTLARRTQTQSLVESLRQHATEILLCDSTNDPTSQLPDAEEILDSLESLLPDSPAQGRAEGGLELSSTDSIFDPPFHNTLLYSILNGFAGVQNPPLGSILKVLRSEQHISIQLFKCLQSSSSPLVKSLADNLFRAAVEAGDAQAVSIILGATSNTPNAINPNEIVCQFQGRGYTPIELAAKFRNLEVVTLLAAQSDVNKTYAQQPAECGALELAIRKLREMEPINRKIVQILLDRGAKIRIDLAESVARSGFRDIELFEELFRRLTSDAHQMCFERASILVNSGSILVNIAQYMENRIATRSIRRIFDACQQTRGVTMDQLSCMGRVGQFSFRNPVSVNDRLSFHIR